MTETEKKEIIDELEQRFESKYRGVLSHEDVGTTLSDVRNKWFKDCSKFSYGSPMARAFDSSIVAWSVWEEIRKLTCRICGVSYVRQIQNADEANAVAEELCTLICTLAEQQKMMRKKHESSHVREQ